MAQWHWYQHGRWPRQHLSKGYLITRRMLAAHSRKLRLALLALGLIVFYVLAIAMPNRDRRSADKGHGRLLWHDGMSGKDDAQWIPATGNIRHDADLGRVANRTLGFEKVFSIGLKERTDKRDAMALMSSVTGFDIDWFEGVRPGQIPDKAVPFGIDVSAVRDNFIGSWRGHMNIIRQ